MSDFDPKTYFDKKLNDLDVQKQADLIKASEEKKGSLRAYRESLMARTPEILAQKEAAANSIVGKLGLDPEDASYKVINNLASFVEGTGRAVGDVVGLVQNIDANAAIGAMTQQQLDAWNRHKAGVATAEDQAILDERPVNRPGTTVREAFEGAERSRTASKNIDEFFNWGSIVDHTQQIKLQEQAAAGFARPWEQITKGYETAKAGDTKNGMTNMALGLGDVLAHAVQTVGDNPEAITEYVTQNLPQLGLGLLPGGVGIMGASNIGYAAENMTQGVEAEIKRTGKLPTEERLREMGMKAAGLALAEQFGEVMTLGATGLTKVVRRGATEAVEGAAKTAERTVASTLKDVAMAPLNVGKAVGQGVLSEGPTEAVQTKLEGDIQGKPATPGEIFAAGLIGAASGAAITGSGRAVAEALDATPEKLEAKAKEDAKAAADTVQLVQAIRTADVSGYTDPTKGTYAPDLAIAALQGNAQQADTTPEQRVEHLKTADKILSDLQAVHESIVEQLALTPQAAQHELNQINERIADPANAKILPQLEQLKAIAEQELADATNMTPAKKASLERQASELGRMLRDAGTNRTQLSNLVNANVDVGALIETVKADVADEASVAARQTAASTIVTLAMSSPEKIDPQVASKLAEDSSNGLSAEQRTYLRAFSKARVAYNAAQDMDKVQQTILHGDTKNLGIDQHRERISAAVGSGNQQVALKALGLLKGFAKDHVSKAKAAKEALKTKAQIVSDGNRNWSINTGKLLEGKAALDNGALVVFSSKLVNSIVAESNALRTAYLEMKAAYDAKFGGANVQNDSQQGSREEAEPQTKGVQGPAPARKSDEQGKQAPAVKQEASKDASEEVITEEDRTQLANELELDDINALIAEARQAEETEKPVSRVQKTDATPSQAATERVAEPAGSQEEAAGTDVIPDDEVVPTSAETLAVLDAINEKSPAGTPFYLKLFGDFFTQKPKRQNSTSVRALVAVKDLINTLSPETALQFLPKGTELSESQKKAITVFTTMAKGWDKFIKANLIVKQGQEMYRHRDAMQYLIKIGADGKPDIESNVKTAIAYALSSYVAENALRPERNSDEEINAILERDEDSIVDPHEQKALGGIGPRQNVVINALGQRIIDALGVEALANVPVNMLPTLTTALGAHALKLGVDRKILTRNEVSEEFLAGLMGKKPRAAAQQHFFIQMERDQKGELNKIAATIAESVKGTGNILDRIFDVDPAMKEPSFEPIPVTAKTAKNSNRLIPDRLRKILEEENKTPFFLRKEMWNVMNQLGSDLMVEIAGGQFVADDEGNALVHAINKKGVESANRALIREVANFVEFVNANMSDKLDAGLYFDHIAWKQYRVGIATNMINPQTSKFHRRMLARKAWESTVNFDNREEMRNFALRVAEGLGIKTDKKSGKAALSELSELVNRTSPDPDTKAKAEKLWAGVEALVKTLADPKAELSAEEKLAIKEAALATGESMHGLDSLMAMAQMQHAKNTKQTSFKTSLMGEIDGVTNGPMLSHFMLGAAEKVEDLLRFLNRGGFFEIGHAHTQYNEYRGAGGNLDLYENTTHQVLKTLGKFMNTGVNFKDQQGEWVEIMSAGAVRAAMPAIYFFTGQLIDKGTITKYGRNIIKTPLTGMVFGSALKTGVENMTNQFMGSIYAKIEEAAKDSQNLRLPTINAINALLRLSKTPQTLIPVTTTMEKLMAYDGLSYKQQAALKTVFRDSVGMAVERTMKKEFATFIDQRKQLNQAAQATFELYNAAMIAERDRVLNEQMDAYAPPTTERDKEGKLVQPVAADPSKGMPWTWYTDKETKVQYRQPLHDLTKEQEAALLKRLDAMLPVANTYFSGSDTRSGLLMSKTARSLTGDRPYTNEVKFATPFPEIPNEDPNTPKRKPSFSAGTRAYTRKLENPGVGTAVMLVHSTDSAISHLAWEKTKQALNIHDAHGTGLAMFKETAQNLNKTTWDVLLEYSPLRATADAMARTLEGLAAQMKAGTLDPQIYADEINELNAALINTYAAAHAADVMKLTAMTRLQAIDQYALDGGNYIVTDEDRAAAQAKLDSLVQGTPKAVLEAMKVISEASKARPSVAPKIEEKTGAAASEAQAAPEPSEQDATPKQEAENTAVENERASWMRLGTPKVAPHPSLVKFFSANPTPSVERVMQGLYKLYDKDEKLPNREFNKQLLKQMYKLVDKNMKVVFVSPTTKMTDLLSVPKTPSRGWYSFVSDKGEQIYVLSHEFTESMLTPEILMHEILHASIAKTIEFELAKKKANPDYTSPALEIIDDLERLRLKSIEFVGKHAKEMPASSVSAYMKALVNVQELTAWGMTNPDFQQNVLSKVSMRSTVRKNELVNGFKAFIKNMIGLFFKGDERSSQALSATGMATLINNVSGLMNESSKSRRTQDVTLDLSMESDPVGVINEWDAIDIFNALDSDEVAPGFREHLSGLIDSIVHKLHGPFDAFRQQAKQNQANNLMDVWSKALDTGVAPFASMVRGAMMRTSQQELFVIEQLEATVLAAIDGSEAQSKLAYRALSDLYEEARSKIRVSDFHDGDWATANSTQRDAAQAAYDFVFEMTSNKATGKSDYLARFAALGLAHHQVNRALQFATKREETKTIRSGKDLLEKLQILVEKILDFFQDKVTHTFEGQPADRKLKALVDQLVDIEARHRARLALPVSPYDNMADRANKAFKGAVESGREAIDKIAKIPVLSRNKNGFIRAMSSGTRLVAQGKVDVFMKVLGDFRDENFRGRLGMLAGLMNDIKGQPAQVLALLLGTKSNERQRMQLIANAAEATMSTFLNPELMTQDQKTALTKVYLRTGAHLLLDHYNMDEILQLLVNPKTLQEAIDTFEANLPKQQKHIWNLHIKALAWHKVTGEASIEMLLQNAHNIARLHGTGVKVTDDQVATAEPLIAPLIALQALKMSPPSLVNTAASVLKTELERPNGENGVEFLLRQHRRLEAESLEKLFDGDPTLMIHGYTPEIHNPHIEVTILSDAEGKEFEKLGYVRVGRVSADPADTDQSAKFLYVLKGVGLPNRVTGAVSNTDMVARGQHKHTGMLNPYSQQGVQNSAVNAAILLQRQQAMHKRYANAATFDPSKTNKTFMVPVLNNQGDFVNWRYMMNEATRDTILERNNDFDRIMGAYAGTIFDKPESRKQNLEVIKALKEIYDDPVTGYAANSRKYIVVSLKSPDQEVRDAWRLIPYQTKKDIAKVWGVDQIAVPIQAYDAIFGYQKRSAANMFKKAYEERRDLKLKGITVGVEDLETINGMQKIMVKSLETALFMYAQGVKKMDRADAENFSLRAAALVAKSERGWQELVHEVKDIIVVKIGTTLVSNVVSNTLFLVAYGVPIKDIALHHRVALTGAINYMRDTKELEKLKAFVGTGYTQNQEDEYRRQIIKLEDAIARNPVTPLVEAGLMPTIVEDVEDKEDPYSYKSALTDWVEEKVKKLPGFAQDVVKQAYMTHDTSAYRFMSKATQLSDFVARYTMYQWEATRKIDPVDHATAVTNASDAFINYDVPLQPGLQYMDDMGMLIFVKYYFRIQRVILRLGKERPVGVLQLILLHKMLGLPTVLDSSMLVSHGYGHLAGGPFALPRALGDLPAMHTAAAGLSLITAD